MAANRGIIKKPQKVVIYGPEGIGKTFFASKFPNPIFIDTEGSTYHMDVAREDKPSSWTMLLGQVAYYKNHPNEYDTLVVDTADWAEILCKEHVTSTAQKTSIADFGYGNGFVYLAEEFGRLLNSLTELIELGMNVVLAAHATLRKIEQPNEIGNYDRWETKLEKKVAALIKEWADIILFANYEIFVVNVDNRGVEKGKNKAQGGKRIMYTTHHPCWDAKNRHDLLDKLPLDFDEIKHCIPARQSNNSQIEQNPKAPAEQAPEPPKDLDPVKKETIPADFSDITRKPAPKVPKALLDLMKPENVTVEEIQEVVASKGYYPVQTPVEKYDTNFINGVLIGAWPQVFGMIKELRAEPQVPY